MTINEKVRLKKEYHPEGEWWHRSRMLTLWEEDDARPVDREMADQAYERITGRKLAHDKPIDTYDGGDWGAKLFRGGWVLIHSCEGGAVAVVVKAEPWE
jgi:hypothetical protein